MTNKVFNKTLILKQVNMKLCKHLCLFIQSIWGSIDLHMYLLPTNQLETTHENISTINRIII